MSSESPRTSKRATEKQQGKGDVGYKRPPKHTQWKEGDPSPNRLGRGAKRQPKPDEMVDAVSRMIVPSAGGDRKATAFEAIWQTAFNEALQGNHRARVEVLKQREAFEAVRPPPPEPQWRVKRVTTYHDGVPVKVEEFPYDGQDGDPIPPPRKKRKARRRKEETYLDIFDRIASTPVTVGTGGKKKRVSAEYAMWLSIFADASQGDNKALSLVNRYGKHARGLQSKPKEEEELEFTLNIGNTPIIDSGPQVSFITEYFE